MRNTDVSVIAIAGTMTSTTCRNVAGAPDPPVVLVIFPQEPSAEEMFLEGEGEGEKRKIPSKFIHGNLAAPPTQIPDVGRGCSLGACMPQPLGIQGQG